MSKNHTTVLRQLVIANNSACNVIWRMAAGSESEVARILDDASKMAHVLKNVTRLKIGDIDRLVDAVATEGGEETKADYNSIATVMMAGYVQNRGNK